MRADAVTIGISGNRLRAKIRKAEYKTSPKMPKIHPCEIKDPSIPYLNQSGDSWNIWPPQVNITCTSAPCITLIRKKSVNPNLVFDIGKVLREQIPKIATVKKKLRPI